MARAADVLAAFRPGMGEADLIGLHQQYGGLDPVQAATAHQRARDFYTARGRAPDEGELEDLYRMVMAVQAQPAQPVTMPVVPGGQAPRPLQPQPLTTGGQAQQGVIEGINRLPKTGMVDRGGSAWGGPMPPTQSPWPSGYMPGSYGDQLSLSPEEADALGRRVRASYGGPMQSPGRMPSLPMPAGSDRAWWETQPGPMYQGGPAAWGPTIPQRPAVQRPWQVNPAVWDSMGGLGQQLALSFAEDEGWDANDYQRQINAARPQGQAQRNVRTAFQPPRY